MRRSLDDSPFPCNSSQSISEKINDSVALTFINISGTIQQIDVRVIPKDQDGIGYEAGANDVWVTVKNLAHPLTDFSATPQNIQSGTPAIFSWTGSPDVSAANIIFDCNPDITITSYGISLPCGAPAFPWDLWGSGSVTAEFTNNGVFEVHIKAYAVPAISNQLYDATHHLFRDLYISPKPKSADSSSGATPQLAVTPLPSPAPEKAYMVQGEEKNPSPNTAQTQQLPDATPIPQSTTGTEQSGVSAISALKALHTIQFTVPMRKGSRGATVSALQVFLAQDPALYPEGLLTGYFGVATERALKKFQVRYGIVQPGVEGYGLVGPKTRAKLNTLEYF